MLNLTWFRGIPAFLPNPGTTLVPYGPQPGDLLNPGIWDKSDREGDDVPVDEHPDDLAASPLHFYETYALREDLENIKEAVNRVIRDRVNIERKATKDEWDRGDHLFKYANNMGIVWWAEGLTGKNKIDRRAILQPGCMFDPVFGGGPSCTFSGMHAYRGTSLENFYKRPIILYETSIGNFAQGLGVSLSSNTLPVYCHEFPINGLRHVAYAAKEPGLTEFAVQGAPVTETMWWDILIEKINGVPYITCIDQLDYVRYYRLPLVASFGYDFNPNYDLSSYVYMQSGQGSNEIAITPFHFGLTCTQPGLAAFMESGRPSFTMRITYNPDWATNAGCPLSRQGMAGNPERCASNVYPWATVDDPHTTPVSQYPWYSLQVQYDAFDPEFKNDEKFHLVDVINRIRAKLHMAPFTWRSFEIDSSGKCVPCSAINLRQILEMKMAIGRMHCAVIPPGNRQIHHYGRWAEVVLETGSKNLSDPDNFHKQGETPCSCGRWIGGSFSNSYSKPARVFSRYIESLTGGTRGDYTTLPLIDRYLAFRIDPGYVCSPTAKWRTSIRAENGCPGVSISGSGFHGPHDTGNGATTSQQSYHSTSYSGFSPGSNVDAEGHELIDPPPELPVGSTVDLRVLYEYPPYAEEYTQESQTVIGTGVGKVLSADVYQLKHHERDDLMFFYGRQTAYGIGHWSGGHVYPFQKFDIEEAFDKYLRCDELFNDLDYDPEGPGKVVGGPKTVAITSNGEGTYVGGHFEYTQHYEDGPSFSFSPVSVVENSIRFEPDEYHGLSYTLIECDADGRKIKSIPPDTKVIDLPDGFYTIEYNINMQASGSVDVETPSDKIFLYQDELYTLEEITAMAEDAALKHTVASGSTPDGKSIFAITAFSASCYVSGLLIDNWLRYGARDLKTWYHLYWNEVPPEILADPLVTFKLGRNVDFFTSLFYNPPHLYTYEKSVPY
jgi:hypothetical protein